MGGNAPFRGWRAVRHALRLVAAAPIRLYQLVVSPLLGSNCNYYPTCSEYTRQAIVRHGVVRGGALGLLRIGRCSSHFYGGNDDVPDSIDWRAAFGEYRARSVRRADTKRADDPEDRPPHASGADPRSSAAGDLAQAETFLPKEGEQPDL